MENKKPTLSQFGLTQQQIRDNEYAKKNFLGIYSTKEYQEELEENNRARSSRLRGIQRIRD